VDALEALISELPERAERIRRRFWRDPGFRTVCEDHRDARQALRGLEAKLPPNAPELEEYRALLRELVAEAIEMLETEDGGGRGGN
jgi:hypothetical protein